MNLSRWIDLGIWTSAMESLVMACGAIVLLACAVSVLARVGLYAVRAVVRLKGMSKAKGEAIE